MTSQSSICLFEASPLKGTFLIEPDALCQFPPFSGVKWGMFIEGRPLSVGSSTSETSQWRNLRRALPETAQREPLTTDGAEFGIGSVPECHCYMMSSPISQTNLCISLSNSPPLSASRLEGGGITSMHLFIYISRTYNPICSIGLTHWHK